MPYYPPNHDFVIGFSGTNNPTLNGTSEQSLFPTYVGRTVLPANWMTQGRVARLVVAGVISTVAVLPTATLKVKLDGTVIASGAASGLLGGAVDGVFELLERFECLSVGAGGTIAVAGRCSIPIGVSGARGEIGLNVKAPIAFDTTVDHTLDVTIQFGQAGNSITPIAAFLELPIG
jgi:hypothetical protein